MQQQTSGLRRQPYGSEPRAFISHSTRSFADKGEVFRCGAQGGGTEWWEREFRAIRHLRMRKLCILFTILLGMAAVGHTQTADLPLWNFKQEFLPALEQAVPKILRSQDQATGRFGSGVWIPGDQSVIYPLAVAWAIKDSRNPCYHDPRLLNAIMRGGDVLAQTQDKDGRWVFRKKDDSTWGMHFDPWVYSRWVRAYSLICRAMPPEPRSRWQNALELGYSGIEKHELTRVHNIPAHHAMGLYVAGNALNHPEWCAKASAFLVRVAGEQDSNGFWSEHLGPVVLYNYVYVDALGTYYGLSHDGKVLNALERAARFHANFIYPDGSNIETIDERTPYSKPCRLPGVGFSFCAEGRGYLRLQWSRLKEQPPVENADTLASLLLYGEEGPIAPSPSLSHDSVFVTQDGNASVVRKGPWCGCLSAYTCPIYPSRWIQDRQNLVSLFHEHTGLVLGGGNTKLQPLWSTFTVGDTGLLKHRVGDESPDFSQPAGLLHVPSKARLEGNGKVLRLEYGQVVCNVAVGLLDNNRARLTLVTEAHAPTSSVEAHLALLPSIGKAWHTASGRTGRLGSTPFTLTAEAAGNWFEHNGWRITLPEKSNIIWPVLPHNPYRKDGRAGSEEGRIVLTLPFSTQITTQNLVVTVME
jgi:hypothetical protein